MNDYCIMFEQLYLVWRIGVVLVWNFIVFLGMEIDI